MDAHIEGVRVAESPSGVVAVVTLGVEDGTDVLPIFVGFEEAASIARGLDATDIGRPLTHDLLLDVTEELGGRVEEAVAIIEHSAMAHLVTENESRQLYYWADGNVMNGEYDLTLVLTGDRAVAGERLTAFFAGSADQVIRTWRGSDELQYLSVPKSPAGTPGHTRVVEPLEAPPYVQLR